MMLPIEGRPILTAAEMKAAELASGVDLFTLMTRAGEGVAEAVARLAAGAEALILCGPGNNGGDGYVAARVLRENGHPVRVCAFADPARDLAQRARQEWSGPVLNASAMVSDHDSPVVVDAVFGTGLTRPLDNRMQAWLNEQVDFARLAIAVDLPSGVASDDGACLSDVSRFDLTLALGAVKPAHLLHPAAECCGAVRLIDLGLKDRSHLNVLDKAVVRPVGATSHKYNRGMVAIVAGAMPGAGALAATAAARAGAGYVLSIGGATDRLPHAIVRRGWSADALDDERINAVVIGPGLGRDDRARERLAAALASPHPLVLDGDALALIAPAEIVARPAPTILTPHAGEFDRLFGAAEGSRVDRARAAAVATGAIVVLKGADTIMADRDDRARITAPGSPWLSTAGTGDVLAGAIGAQLATRITPFEAAAAGVWLHAEAARRCGASFIADDLAHALTAARASL